MFVAHLDDELLDQYAMGRLAEDRLAEVEEHLLICAACQTRLLQVDEFLAAFRGAAVSVNARGPSRWQTLGASRTVFWTASVVAAAALLFLAVRGDVQMPPAAAVVMMKSFRGPTDIPHITSGKPALLNFDLAVPVRPAKYQIEIVDLDGNLILSNLVQADGGQFTVPVKKLNRGSYWVRVYRNEGPKELIQECGIRAE